MSNSSPLIALTQIGRLDLPRRLHTRISNPPAVAREAEPTVAKLPDWVPVKAPAHPLFWALAGRIGALTVLTG